MPLRLEAAYLARIGTSAYSFCSNRADLLGFRHLGDTELDDCGDGADGHSGMVHVGLASNLRESAVGPRQRAPAGRSPSGLRLQEWLARAESIRQLVMEGPTARTRSAAVALGVAWWAAARISSRRSRHSAQDIAVDTCRTAGMLAVIGAACVLSAIVFSLGPALSYRARSGYGHEAGRTAAAAAALPRVDARSARRGAGGVAHPRCS